MFLISDVIIQWHSHQTLHCPALFSEFGRLIRSRIYIVCVSEARYQGDTSYWYTGQWDSSTHLTSPHYTQDKLNLCPVWSPGHTWPGETRRVIRRFVSVVNVKTMWTITKYFTFQSAQLYHHQLVALPASQGIIRMILSKYLALLKVQFNTNWIIITTLTRL